MGKNLKSNALALVLTNFKGENLVIDNGSLGSISLDKIFVENESIKSFEIKNVVIEKTQLKKVIVKGLSKQL